MMLPFPSSAVIVHRRRVWMPASAAIGLAGIHLHDLRHTGNQFRRGREPSGADGAHGARQRSRRAHLSALIG